MIQVVNREPAAGQAGRVKLTLDDGTVMEGVLEMSDGADPEGTPWNAQTGRLLQADIRAYPAATAITAGDVVDISNGQATTDGTPSQGIALQTVQAGGNVDVIFSGITYAGWATKGNEIVSGGVTGYSPIDGVISVVPADQISRYIYGNYTGNGAKGRVINLGAEPKIVFITRSEPGDDHTNMVFDTIFIVNGVTYNTDPVYGNPSEALAIVSNGFRVSHNAYYGGNSWYYDGPQTNRAGTLYNYTAIF